jgi:hypothetical protein
MRTAALIPLLLLACGILEPDGSETMEVAEARVPCIALGPRDCLLVRMQPDGEFGRLYDEIHGFVYEPGYRYRLRVSKRAIRNPPADGSSIEFRLVRVVSKVRSPRFALFEQVRDAQAAWLATGPDTYTMVVERVCYCAPEGRGPVRLEVTRRDGNWVSPFEDIVSSHYVSDGRRVPAASWQQFPGVQGLFGIINYAIASDAHEIRVEMDPAGRGFPVSVYVDWRESIADDEIEYRVLSLTPA